MIISPINDTQIGNSLFHVVPRDSAEQGKLKGKYGEELAGGEMKQRRYGRFSKEAFLSSALLLWLFLERW